MVHRWKAEFLQTSKQGLIAGRSGPSTREQQVEAAFEIRERKKGGRGSAGTHLDLEAGWRRTCRPRGSAG